jgi:hypothetical protein
LFAYNDCCFTYSLHCSWFALQIWRFKSLEKTSNHDEGYETAAYSAVETSPAGSSETSEDENELENLENDDKKDVSPIFNTDDFDLTVVKSEGYAFISSDLFPSGYYKFKNSQLRKFNSEKNVWSIFTPECDYKIAEGLFFQVGQ